MKLTDIFLNVFLPLLAGIALYLTKENLHQLPFLTTQAADGLWAYAFASAILFVWERRIHSGWVSLAFIVCLLFEWAQYHQWVAGTADWWDVVAYTLGFALALLLNKSFQHRFIPKSSI